MIRSKKAIKGMLKMVLVSIYVNVLQIIWRPKKAENVTEGGAELFNMALVGHLGTPSGYP